MILDTRNMRLQGYYTTIDMLNGIKVELKNVHLQPLEYRFISALCNNKLVLYDDLFEYVFKTNDKTNMRRLFSNLIARLKRKIDLQLEARNSFGYILRDEVYIV